MGKLHIQIQILRNRIIFVMNLKGPAYHRRPFFRIEALSGAQKSRVVFYAALLYRAKENIAGVVD